MTDTSTQAVTALLDGVTAGPWALCAHLSKPNENGCTCGYRGVIYAGDSDFAICQPGHDPAPIGEEGTEPPRLPRNAEILNSRFIAAARDLVPALLAERDALAADVARLTAQLDAARDRALDEALEILEWRRPKKEDRSLVAAKVAFVAAYNEIRALKDAAP